LFANDN